MPRQKHLSIFRLKPTALGIMLLGALLVRTILFIAIMTKNPEKGFLSYDSYGYLSLSKNLINHQIFSRADSGTLYHDIYRTPTYPIFLSAFRNIPFSIFIQILISVGSCLLLYCIAIKINLPKKYAILTGTLLALDLPSIVSANLIMTETLFTFFLLAAVFFLFLWDEKRKLWFLGACGITLGLAILCRPIAQFLPFILICFIVWKAGKSYIVKSLAFFTIGLTIILLPWMMRNQYYFNEFIISSSGPINFCSWQVSNVLSQKNNQPIGKVRSEFWKMIYQKSGIKKRTPYDMSMLNLATKEGFKILASEKTMTTKQHVRGVFNVLAKPVRRDLSVQLGYEKGFAFEQKTSSDVQHSYNVISDSFPLIQFFLFFQIIVLITMYGCIIVYLFFKNLQILSHPKKLLLLVIICYFFNLNTPPVSNSRLRVPFIPFLIAISVSGLYLANTKLQRSRVGH